MTVVYSRHFELRMTNVANEGVVLHLGSRQYFSVNETGAAILNALDRPRTLGELVHRLTDEYDVTPDAAEPTVRAFLDRCCSADLLRAEEH